MLFVFKNAFIIFQKLINNTLEKYLNNFVITYFNNILIYSDNLKMYYSHVHKILKKLNKRALYMTKLKAGLK